MKKVSKRDRWEAVALYERGYRPTVIAEMYGVNRSTLWRWIRKFGGTPRVRSERGLDDRSSHGGSDAGLHQLPQVSDPEAGSATGGQREPVAAELPLSEMKPTEHRRLEVEIPEPGDPGWTPERMLMAIMEGQILAEDERWD